MKNHVVAPAERSVTYEFERVSSCSKDLLSSWAQLTRQLGLNPTLSPPWSKVIHDALAPATANIRVLIRREPSGRLSGVLPFRVSKRRMSGISVSVLEPASNLLSYHAEIVADGRFEEMLAGVVERCGRWDVLHFANVVDGSATEAALNNLSVGLGCDMQRIAGDTSPYLPIRGSWADYLAGRSKKFRYRHRQRSRHFTNENGFEVRVFREQEEVDRLLGEIRAIESRSWKAPAGLAITQREAENRYHELLLPMLASELALLGIVLYKAEEPIAFSLCCCFEGWVGHLKTSFDEDYSHLSPGAHVIDLSVEWAFQLRAWEFDFLGDAAAHKIAWTTSVRRHYDYFLFGPSVRGHILGRAKRLLRLMRPTSFRNQHR